MTSAMRIDCLQPTWTHRLLAKSFPILQKVSELPSLCTNLIGYSVRWCCHFMCRVWWHLMDSLGVELPSSRSGWTMSTALGRSHASVTVRVTGGGITTVTTGRMQGWSVKVWGCEGVRMGRVWGCFTCQVYVCGAVQFVIVYSTDRCQGFMAVNRLSLRV